MNELALFAGIGGGILGGSLLGFKCVCAVEIDAYCRNVLIKRQNDGTLPAFPIWDDVSTFNGKDWRGVIDIVSGGFPCQDISVAGKGAGITGERSGLWKEMLRIIREVRPRFAFVENVPALVSRGLSTVLGDLAEIGYDAEWCVLGADDVGANHHRKRIWILAYVHEQHGDYARHGAGKIRQQAQAKIFRDISYPSSTRGRAATRGPLEGQEAPEDIEPECLREDVPDSEGSRCKGHERTKRSEQKHSESVFSSWWETEPDICRVVDGNTTVLDGVIRRFGYEYESEEAIAAIDTFREKILREMRKEKKSSKTSYGSETGYGHDFMSEMPFGRAHEKWYLGKRIAENESLRDLWKRICSASQQEAQDLLKEMLFGIREIERAKKMAKNRINRLRALGNAQVPIQMAEAFLSLYNVINRGL